MYNDLPYDLKIKLFFHNLNLIFTELHVESDITAILSKLLDNLTEFFNIENANFYLVLNNKITSIAAIGENNLIEINLSDEDKNKFIATNSVLTEEELSFYPSISNLTTETLRVKLLIPLNYDNNLLGFITLGPLFNQQYEETDKFFLSMISTYTARMIFSSNAYLKASGTHPDEIYIKNITDILSEVYIKPYIEQRMYEGVKEAIRYKKPYSLALVTIDNFENLRKTHGQQMINDLLQSAGSVIKKFLRRDVDLAGKYSEDTFLILLPSTERKGAIVFSEKIKAQLSRLSVEKYPQVIITVSIGITSLEANDKNKDELFGKVLEALDYSIRKGGNKLSFNYDELISEHLSDFEKASGISSNLLKESLEHPVQFIDENGNEIDFTKPSGTHNWINIPKKY